MAKIDDSVKKKVPELRFKGFTDEWEERKFKDILKTHSFRSYLAGVSENGEYEVIQQGDKPIVGYSDGEPFTDYKDVTLFGDHTVSLYKPKSPFFVATDGVKILSADNFEGNYLYTTLERYKPEPQGYKRHFTILKNQDVWFTENMEEQQKIGSFFKQLDDTIALHQHKLDLLKEQKKGFLQKMFPKNGAKVPELRFAGFDDDWEERKLEDISEIIDGDRGKNYPSGDDFKNNGHTLFLSAANVTKQGFLFKETQYITKLKSESLGSGKVILNDIILTSRGSIGHIGFYDKKTHEYIPQARINSGMLILRTDKLNSPSFIAQFLKSPWGIKQIKLISFGSAQPQLTKKDIKNFKIILPKMEEQEKIGSFFQKLDDTIALHQRKLDLLKEQKKGFLQKMFV
ncbi:restriction endonuclease subunit S [Lactococcus formosensis]|nr:restriction endonuclease subunit S [Lactococcus formosensis]MDG6112573.1 restriction endonuclease subunit S [Lactococcus formosensis]MDG6154724.1 restriction endonuclease subunit S [Lactococcus formosensis]MDG6173703.1 restriction endonuclease subunit S [Lactococcus formosensis]MDG6180018.1 restriction endonuclease subunit S [Lactococcus formosensis]MDG6184216.1 restriction endonuclease subunit S [Lactococcus formosensis]